MSVESRLRRRLFRAIARDLPHAPGSWLSDYSRFVVVSVSASVEEGGTSRVTIDLIECAKRQSGVVKLTEDVR